MEKYILIYSDEGTSKVGVESLMLACEKKLGLKSIKIIAKDIIETNVLDNCEIIIFPGGMANFYCKKLNGEGNRRIKKFIEKGGLYIGICAGSYYACDRLDFHGEEFDVVDKWELKLFDGIAKGSLSELTIDNRFYDETPHSKNFVKLNFTNKKMDKNEKYYYHGGPEFIPYENNENFNVIAKFENGKNAIITGKVGKGNYILSSVHFELQKECYEKIILKNSFEKEYERELLLYNELDDKYGNEIWDFIKNKFL